VQKFLKFMEQEGQGRVLGERDEEEIFWYTTGRGIIDKLKAFF
jgi:hypothetical protein